MFEILESHNRFLGVFLIETLSRGFYEEELTSLTFNESLCVLA
jgi:hypothetical protein